MRGADRRPNCLDSLEQVRRQELGNRSARCDGIDCDIVTDEKGA